MASFNRLDGVVGNAARGFIVFEELQHPALGRVETLYSRADVLALGFMFDRGANSQRRLLKLGLELTKGITMRRPRLRRRDASRSNGENGQHG
jgi:hypothetical protein